MKTSQTKTPNSILENVLTEVDEARTLLSTIMRDSPDDEKTDSALACLIRSLERTLQTGYEFIDNSPPSWRLLTIYLMLYSQRKNLRR